MAVTVDREAERLCAILQQDNCVEALSQYIKLVNQKKLQTKQIINRPVQLYNRCTAVHLAASKGLWECLELLLKNGGDPNAISSETDLRQTPLHHAALNGRARCLQILLDHGATMDRENARHETALDMVKGKPRCEKILEQAAAKTKIPNRTQEEERQVEELHKLAAEGSTERFKQLYETLPEQRRDLSTRWNDFAQKTLLTQAAISSSVEISQYILSQSPKEPLPCLSSGETPLFAATQRGHINLARVHLNHSPGQLFKPTETNKITPLHYACYNGDVEMVRVFLQCILTSVQKGLKVSLNQRDVDGQTPFYCACCKGHTQTVDLLLAFARDNWPHVDLDVNVALPDSKRTPLHAATERQSFDVAKLLVAHPDLTINAEAKASRRFLNLLVEQLERRKLVGDGAPDCLQPADGASRPSPTTPRTSNNSTPVLSCTSPSPRVWRTTSSGEQGGGGGGGGAEAPPTGTSVGPSKTAAAAYEAIYLSDSGDFEVGPLNPPRGGQDLCQSLLTPLALACVMAAVHKSTDVVRLYLEHGARDANGMACRLALLLGCPQVAMEVLCYHCRATMGPFLKQPMDLCVKWSDKSLPQVHPQWLRGSSATFRPAFVNEEGDEVVQTGEEVKSMALALDWALVTAVELQRNCLKGVPAELFQLKNVRTINLAHNRLSSLPGGDTGSELGAVEWECPNLEVLILNENVLTTLPPCVWGLHHLASLCANNNLIEIFTSPDESLPLSQTLEVIELSFNKMSTVPAFMFTLPGLKRVALNNNNITSLPGTVWESSSLKELNVASNYLSDLSGYRATPLTSSQQVDSHKRAPLPTEKRLPARVEVRLPAKPRGATSEHQPQQEQPKGIQLLDEREELCWSNYLAPGSEKREFSSLSKLDLSSNQFKRFPEALACLAPNLVELDVSSNEIEEIQICLLPQSLQKFTARRCGIRRFGYNPATLNKHGGSLKVCCHTSAPDLPCEHRGHHQLQGLVTLTLQKNSIQSFGLSLLSGLFEVGKGEEDDGFLLLSSSLDLFYPVLGGLDLSHNDLRGTFTREIRFQVHLKWIKLGDNPLLERLPMEFGYLKSTRQFTELSIDNLPNLIDPPKEYQSLNSNNLNLNHLLSYMKARLKKSEYYRSIKLFLIGREERGKSTLLRRLKGLPEQQLDRTVGIDIADWEYPEPSSIQLHRQERVRFLLWDFAGQDVYSTTHQCFYSRRSLYLALFRLTDGEVGVKELEPWLRNVQLRAPGCPVIIVGTHLDRVSAQQAQELILFASQYYQDSSIYPRVVNVLPVSATQKNIFLKNNIEALRKCIYHVSCHLQVSGQDGISLEYKKDMPENDPKALFQQQVPKSFLDLQDRIREEVADRAGTGDSPPIMDAEQFQAKFGDIFEDQDDLQEAVYFLHLQGTLLHFEDIGLRNIYFLDPQWLAKLMADVINPSATSNSSIKNGTIIVWGGGHGPGKVLPQSIGKVGELFDTRDVKKELKENYIQLLQKFEVALKLNHTHVIIPSLMPLSAPYPPSHTAPGDVPPLRRVWLSKFILDGFWPRLICRVAVDKHITRTLDSVVGTTTTLETTDQPLTNWVIWKTGMVYACDGKTLLSVKQEKNGVASSSPGTLPCLFEGGMRVELTVYVSALKALTMVDDSVCVAKATQILVMVSQHVASLAMDWFPGMLHGSQEPTSYIPCWKCVDKVSDVCGEVSVTGSANGILWAPDRFVHLFVTEECIVPAAKEENLVCSVHGQLDLGTMAPDLTFQDIEGDAGGTLNILTDELLGKGGYGFVSRGELLTQENCRQGVAVKVFLQSTTEINTVSQSELKKHTTDPKQLVFSYQQIRREVSFLSNLNNAHLTQLCGVKMQPCMCLLLELAPQRNLRHHLKQYKEHAQSLEPFTLKVTIRQIVEALDYLHGQQVVHLDVKSSNVLVWYFPSPTTNRKQRLFLAGNVYVKLADYGISQLSTGSMIKVVNNPVGTPGYMAPEMFGGIREVSAEKIDIFAFGMTVYEMLSLRVPFDDVKAIIKRNHEVKSGGRPTLKGKEIRTPIIVQDLMAVCWDQDPEGRPKMRHIKEWLQTPEFELLRAEVALGSVKTISCACVCRISPDQEEGGESLTSDGKEGPLCLRSSLGVEQDTSCFKQYASTGQQGGHGDGDHGDGSSQPSQSSPPPRAGQPFRSSSQIWLCGRDQRKGMVQIFKYYDGQPDTYLLTSYLDLGNVNEIAALCPVKNMMWMGTDSGNLVVCHAPSLKVKCMHKLSGDPIFDIAHVGEASMVVVTTRKGELWCFKDRPGPQGLQVEQVVSAGDAVYRIVKVVAQESIQVWGSMDSNTVFLMEWVGGKEWKRVKLPPCDSGNAKIVLLSCVAHSSFRDVGGKVRDYVWMAYRNRSVVVCWDAQCKRQLVGHTVDCSKELERHKQQLSDNAGAPADKCESLATYNRKLFVGTTGGCVLVVDAEKGKVTNVLSWHVGKVRTLLVMPKEVEPCVCAEVQFNEEGAGTSEEAEPAGVPHTDNPFMIHNPSDPDACMVTSIGNGRRKFTVAKQLVGQQYGRSLSLRIEDLFLLTWRN